MQTIFILDDHDIVRFGLETLFTRHPEFQLLGSAASLKAGVEQIAHLKPDLVITDMVMGDSRGLDTVRAVVQAQEGRAVLVVSMHDEMVYGEHALTIGARGYLMKDVAHTQAIPAAREILSGGTWASPRLTNRMLGRLLKRNQGEPGSRSADSSALTPREIEVLESLARGKSTKEVAAELDVSARTIDIHRASIKRKLRLRTGAELIAFALSRL